MPIVKRKTTPAIDYSDNPKPSSFPVNIVASEKQPLPETNLKPSVTGEVMRRAGFILQDTQDALNVADMLNGVRTPYDPNDYAEMKYRARVRNRGTAITAKCVDCQGGSRKRVSECMSTACPLWSFRFGSDPFFRRRG